MLSFPPAGCRAGAAPYTLVLHVGDVSYARGFGALWDTFLLQQAPLAERMAYATALGNHERDWPGSEDIYQVLEDSGGFAGVGGCMKAGSAS